MLVNLKKFQEQAIDGLFEAIYNDKKNIILESCTGSGKTVILAHFINQFMKENHDYITVWFCPGKGNLEEQSKFKMDTYFPMASTKLLQDVLNVGFDNQDTVFINWELVTKKGNKALADGERSNLIDMVEIAKGKGIKFLVVIDEGHLNKTIKSQEVVEIFNPTKIIKASATPRKDPNAIHLQISEEKVMQEGLIKNMLVINENVNGDFELEDQTGYLLEQALTKQDQIKIALNEKESYVNPLIVVQIPNKSNDLLASVEDYFFSKGVTYENNQLAVWLTEKKENLEDVVKSNSSVRAIIIKQAIATGWDCPRAYILVKLRENMSETFEIQTIGRIRRMPEAKHYGNSLLDSCYLYTFDEKFKEGVKEFFDERALEGITLKLKSDFKNIKLKKEKISSLNLTIDPIHTLEAFTEFLKDEYDVKEKKFKDNIAKLTFFAYEFDKNIKVKTYKGNISTLREENLSNLDTVTLSVVLDTNEHGRVFHQVVNKISRSLGISYDNMSIVLRRVFCDNPSSKSKILALEPKLLYAFVINNSHRLETDLKKAISSEKYRNIQLKYNIQDPTEEYYLPKEILFTYDARIKNFKNYEKNVYEDYISSASPRSQGEKLFEKYCEYNDKIEWFYKNGDKGNDFFTIVYNDNAGKKRHFYPDYILSVDNEIWIVEVKGGESDIGKNEDRDDFSEKKMKALMQYCKDNMIKGGFVRLNKADMSLYMSTTMYSDNLFDSCWCSLEEFF